ncbi:MTAP family purine nucleoside phosphorylase [Arthrobacter sp. ISL-69]|uniref:MTAP family purine nucleoside phosphorylase n=1 Tax=Arthrobacter sp. ISL-69 TaxID=2819113 RepID=UPI001BE5A283|nr:MTAP family purine nucleoside phosphorylase [Arthrobacter sp. ISL-69]MBT2538475.1 MTAP family purine nucleoside phosphorylase [Arthrobacter sp. ISL-69]
MGTAPPSSPPAHIGVIGGSGTYRLPGATVLDTFDVDTPYGAPSGPVTLAEVAGRTIAFLPRHGGSHQLPPQKINYRANLWALKSLGVEAVLSSSAVGGLHSGFAPETFVVTDQLIDRTWGRADTYFDGTVAEGVEPAGVRHLPASESFCPTLRAHLDAALAAHDLAYVPHGTVVVVNGPRFSTKAESAWYVTGGADIISMTQYPEPVLAAELNMGLANLAYITDSDTGHDGSTPVTAEAVFARLTNVQHRILAVLDTAITAIGPDYAPRTLMDPEAVDRIMSLPLSPERVSSR